MDLGAALAVSGLAQLFTGEAIVAFLTLAALEIVLGIDNLVFLTILTGRVEAARRARARQIGLALALGLRVLLLLAIGWVMGLTAPLVEIPSFWTSEAGDAHTVSGRDLILLVGGLFLIGKATYEIHDKLEGSEHAAKAGRAASFGAVIVQIALIDLVFSLDSVITAVGMVKVNPEAPWVGLTIMITAVVVAMITMLLTAGRVASFVERHPTIKMLALSFLILIGVMLVAEGFHAHLPRGYVYFAMAFSLAVELLNMRVRRTPERPVALHQSYVAPDAPPSTPVGVGGAAATDSLPPPRETEGA